ncbi:hypothetical protein AURDEDRAFT_130389 [Auricularia subglabra TFB-10046 SS5]|nr:hypothetical protein AURDEDRAFT_130389 [Auricularia subglabra TFB-10046 SS5]
MPAPRLIDDILRCVADFCDTPQLLALCRVSRHTHALCTPALYARVRVGDYCTFFALTRTLAARPHYAAYIRSFDETRPFFFNEDAEGDEANPDWDLAPALAKMTGLRALRLVSRLDLPAPALRPLRLDTLALPSLAENTARALDTLRPVARLHVHAQQYLAPHVARYVRRCAPRLTHLRLDAHVLPLLAGAVFPRLRELGVHGVLDAEPDPAMFPALAAAPVPLRCGATCALCKNAVPEEGPSKACGLLGSLRRAWALLARAVAHVVVC